MRAHSLIKQCIAAGVLSVILSLDSAYALSVHGIKEPTVLENVQERLKISEKDKRYQGRARAELIKEDVKKATQPYGYYTPNTRVSGDNVFVSLGKPVLIKNINIKIDGEGRDIFHNMPQKSPLERGKPFNSEQYEKAKQELFNAAEQHGYLKATMVKSQATVDIATHQAYILIHFDTGKRFYFGPFRFKRKTYYNETFLRRYIQIQPGAPYSTEKLLGISDNFNGSGYFQQVSVKPQVGGSTSVPVDITLVPKVSQHYSVGAGFGTDTGPRGRLGAQLLQLNPYGHTLQFLILGSMKQSALQAQYMIPGYNPVTEQFYLSASAFQLDYPVGKSFGQIFYGGFLFHKNNYRLTANLNLLNEPTTYTDRERIQASLVYPSIEAQLRKVSDPLFSKQGYNVTVKGLISDKVLLASERFSQLSVDARAAMWINFSNTRLYGRGFIGQTWTNDVFQLPLSLQLLAGGSDSIRGFDFQSIGPGKRKYVVSLEVQQQVVENWFVTAFGDLGSVYDPTVRRDHYSVGGGMMWTSPVGPIRIGVAYPLSKDKPTLKLIFSMGPDL